MARESTQNKRSKTKLIIRLLVPMLMLVLFQLVTFFAILISGEEFSHMRRYAYNTLVEKTENRRNDIENVFQQKIPIVRDSADKINSLVKDILYERGESISDIQTDKELNRLIMEDSVGSMIELLRRSMANDVYMIIDTGDLYSGENGSGNAAKSALYFRDLDPITDAGYEDILMEMGLSSISQSIGITLDSGWKLYFEPDPQKPDDYDYYYKTIQNAQENSSLSIDSLGCWTNFSSISRSTSASLKYTVPLISEDGTVYGVLGIGLTENTILSHLPVHDFMSETACYVLGHSVEAGKSFDVVTHSGNVFNRLVGNTSSVKIGEEIDENIFDFDMESSVSIIGSVQYLSIYGTNSPYYGEQWAIISVADKSSVLQSLNGLVELLIVSAAISFAVSLVILLLLSQGVVKPISAAIKTMNENREYNQVIRFEPSNIYEIDKMTDAITQLQINVQDFSSQVSKMIRIANVGLGTFMYDRTDDSVFVGQSLRRLLNNSIEADEDIVMDRETFIESIVADETRFAIAKSLKGIAPEKQSDTIREYSIAREDGSIAWMRLSIVNNKNKSIGILQDITGVVMEKRRIEYERDYDSITGLLNRHAYQQKLEEVFADPDELGVTAIIMLDLDNLKFVNDTYGHDFGDDYIKTAATALKEFQKFGGIVSRLSGDEFNICLHGFSSKEEVREIINKVREQLLGSYCLLVDGTHFKVRASMGVSWYPDDATSYEMLMKYADFAMYTVKHSTKGEIAEFDMTSYEKDAVLITGVEEMNRIIDECSVKYAFQSIVSAKTGEIYGYEALMRPQSAILHSPLELLRIAKTSARLYEIEKLTWIMALGDFQTQIDAGRISKDCHLFINSISNCVMEPSDADAVEEAHAGLLEHVVLEVLESEYSNEEYNARKVDRIKRWKAQIALDDFGTGYNSEYALITMHPDIVKIDRSIISGCDKDISRRMIITSLVKLARSKNILVLAEGVETEEELQTVISCGVDLLQGYYINRPVFEPQPLTPEIVDTIRQLSKVDETV